MANDLSATQLTAEKLVTHSTALNLHISCEFGYDVSDNACSLGQKQQVSSSKRRVTLAQTWLLNQQPGQHLAAELLLDSMPSSPLASCSCCGGCYCLQSSQEPCVQKIYKIYNL